MAKKRRKRKNKKFKIKNIIKRFFLMIFLSVVVFGVYKNENINVNDLFRKYIKGSIKLPLEIEKTIEKLLKNIENIISSESQESQGSEKSQGSQETQKSEKSQKNEKNQESEEYRVIYVSDGDTISVKKLEKGVITGELIKVRLLGIDAPETKQDYGYESKEALMKMIKDKNIKIKGKAKDRYGRLLGVIYHNEKNINEEMVKSGNAWWYEEYDKKNEIMKQYEENAKKNKLGLFSKKNPIAPWEFRKNKKKLKN